MGFDSWEKLREYINRFKDGDYHKYTYRIKKGPSDWYSHKQFPSIQEKLTKKITPLSKEEQIFNVKRALFPELLEA